MALSAGPFKAEDRLAKPPGDRWCDVFGFVPAGSVSSFSTLQIFREAEPSLLFSEGCEFFPPVYLLGRKEMIH